MRRADTRQLPTEGNSTKVHQSSTREVTYIGVPRHIVEERMQPFHLRAIERGGGAAVSAADFYAFQQRQGAWGRDAA